MSAQTDHSIGWAAVRASAAARGVVVIGAGQAGGRAAEALRAQGFAGPVTLVGDEGEYPYERPSLSKEMLLNPKTESITWVQKPEFYAAKNIELIHDDQAIAVDRQARSVALKSGRDIPYGVLLLATGARVRKLDVPGVSDSNCFYLRNLADSRALRDRFSTGHRVVVIGAGFIGLEAAAAAIQRGCMVTLIELGPKPLGRVVPEQIGDYYQRLHEAHGVRFFFGAAINKFHQLDETVIIELSNGDMIPAETVIAGIGVLPNSDLAANAGLKVERGIIVDEFARTEDPFIFAAGDVARYFSPMVSRHILLESWQNAQNQAIAFAKNISGSSTPAPYAELPWFWSDQYDVNLQMFGLADPDAQTIIRGEASQKSWMLLQLKEGKLICAIGMNVARELRAARDLIILGADLSPGDMQAVSVPLIDILRREKAAALVNS